MQLIVNADDFGLTAGINRGVEHLVRAGVLRSATLMAGGAAFQDAVAVAQRNPDLGVGCHLVFVDGSPMSDPSRVPTLLGASRAGFHSSRASFRSSRANLHSSRASFRSSLADFLQAAMRGCIAPEEIALEAEAQIRTLQAAGLSVTHVDTHKHVHCLPAVAQAVAEAARRCGVAALRTPWEPAWSSQLAHAPAVRRLQQWALQRWERPWRRRMQSSGMNNSGMDLSGMLSASGTLGIAATGTLDAALLSRTLQAAVQHSQGAPDQTWELCCHPGYADHDLSAVRTRLQASRQREMDALLATLPRFTRDCAHPGSLRLIHYGELAAPGNLEPRTGW